MEIINYKKLLVNSIIGLYGISGNEFLSQMEKLKEEDLKISYIDSENFEFCTNTFKSEVRLNPSTKRIDNKIIKELSLEYCKLFSLREDVFSRKIGDLSSSEKYILYIIFNLLFESDVYIFNKVNRYLDKVNIKKLLAVLKKIKESGKTVIIIDNINVLYDITDEIYLFKDNNVVLSGNTKDVLTDVDSLIRKKIPVPDLPLITYLAKKKKGVKLFYHSDVRDIIKDVYKHV